MVYTIQATYSLSSVIMKAVNKFVTFINMDFKEIYFIEELGRLGYSLPDISANKNNNHGKVTSRLK